MCVIEQDDLTLPSCHWSSCCTGWVWACRWHSSTGETAPRCPGIWRGGGGGYVSPIMFLCLISSLALFRHIPSWLNHSNFRSVTHLVLWLHLQVFMTSFVRRTGSSKYKLCQLVLFVTRCCRQTRTNGHTLQRWKPRMDRYRIRSDKDR